MIPILYESTEMLFNSNGLGRLRDCISCVVTEERNGVYECDFEYPVDGPMFDRIQLGMIIAVEHDDTDDIQPFDIVGMSRPINGVVSYHAVHVSYRQNYITTSGSNINSVTAALNLCGNAQGTPFTYQTDKTNTGYFPLGDGIPHTVRSILGGAEGSILDTYGGEYSWDKFNVFLHSERGVRRDFSIRYGVNMVDYTEELDSSGTYMSVIPYWKSETEKVVGDKQTYGRTITNRGECIALDVSDKFESKPTKAQVNSAGLSYLKSNRPYTPTQNIHVEFVRLQDTEEYRQYAPLQKCQLCDTIPVIFPRYGLKADFKIVKTEYDVLADRFLSMELGDLSTTLSEALGISDSSSRGADGLATTTVADYITLASGWNCSALSAVKVGRVVQVRMDLTYNADISVPATGNITDLTIGTVKTDWWPVVTAIFGSWGNGAGSTHGMINTSGAMILCAFGSTGAARTVTAGTAIHVVSTYIS